jgi:ABC-type sugar transport system, periplasmic component
MEGNVMKNKFLAKVIVGVVIVMMMVSVTMAAPKEVMVGYAVMRMVDEYWGNQIDGMKQAIKESGRPIRLEVADSNNDGQTCLQNVLSLIGRGVKVLIVSTPDPKIGGAIMEAANKKHIPVIASDVYIDGAYFLTHDEVKAGALMGEYAGNYFTEKFKGKKAVVAILTHAAVATQVDQRINGFKTAFGKAIPDATFLPVMDAEGLREKGANVMADILTAHPDVNIMFGINDDITLGAASAVEARGLSDKVACFGQGGIGEASFQALLDPQSPFKATSAFMPSGCGMAAINQLVIPLLDKKKVATKIFAPLKVADIKNAKEFLKK